MDSSFAGSSLGFGVSSTAEGLFGPNMSHRAKCYHGGQSQPMVDSGADDFQLDL
jgi:hypothetical protein